MAERLLTDLLTSIVLILLIWRYRFLWLDKICYAPGQSDIYTEVVWPSLDTGLWRKASSSTLFILTNYPD